MSKRNKFKSGDWNDQSKGGKKLISKNRKEKLGKSKSEAKKIGG